MKKLKDKTYAFRVSSADLEKIKSKAQRARRTVTEYLTACALEKQITVVDGLDALVPELKAQGRNLNQLTTLAHMGRFQAAQLDAVTGAYGDICAELKRLTGEVR